MSDEAQALEVEENIDFTELLATQGEEESDYEGEELDESSIPDELPEDPEELKALLVAQREQTAKKKKYLNNSKKANHRMQKEIEELAKKLDELSSKPAPVDTGAKDQEYKEALEQWRESVADDPSKAVDFAQWQTQTMQSQMVDYIANMQSKLENAIEQLNGKTDPERLKYQKKIDSLRGNPEFADVPEEMLIKFIRASEKVKVPRGGLGGQRVNATEKSVEKQIEEAKKQYQNYYQNGV
jgi:hypothetical protein